MSLFLLTWVYAISPKKYMCPVKKDEKFLKHMRIKEDKCFSGH